ncbi:MAG: cytochrome P450 [Gammaproteobacteria bacterium]|nr:cytochrome P450 [Gammaproteobacteria bacterium]
MGNFALGSHEFDLRSLPAEFYLDPYPTYALLRSETPLFQCPDGSYFLTRYADLNAIYRDARRFSSDKKLQFAPVFGEGSPLYEHHTTSLVFNDPPLHTRVRKAIGNALSNRVVETMRAGLEALVEDLLVRMEGLEEVDIVADYAAAIPVEVIGNLLSIPKDERGPLRRWSLGILGGLEVGLDSEKLVYGNQCVEEFLAYLNEFIARRRKRLTNEDDILARLLRWESDGERLSSAELYHQCIFLLNAGHETTTNLIGNGVELLLRFPASRDQLIRNPSLVDSAVEEMLRYESSNQLGNRTTTQSVEIGGVEIPAGTVLTLCIGAANRDPAQIPHPDAFDISRHPNAHLAFGAGIHTCAGLNVARMEARVAIARLFERFPHIELRGAQTRSDRARFRGFTRLPVGIG